MKNFSLQDIPVPLTHTDISLFLILQYFYAIHKKSFKCMISILILKNLYKKVYFLWTTLGKYLLKHIKFNRHFYSFFLHSQERENKIYRNPHLNLNCEISYLELVRIKYMGVNICLCRYPFSFRNAISQAYKLAQAQLIPCLVVHYDKEGKRTSWLFVNQFYRFSPLCSWVNTWQTQYTFIIFYYTQILL